MTAVLLSSHWTWNTPGSRTQTLRLKGQQEESSDLSDFHLHHQHSRGEGGETRRLLSGQLRTWVWSWNKKKTTSGWRLLETDWFIFFINTWKSLPLVWLIPGQTSRCLSRLTTWAVTHLWYSTYSESWCVSPWVCIWTSVWSHDLFHSSRQQQVISDLVWTSFKAALMLFPLSYFF